MAILLTPAIINRATAKFMREKIIKENIGDTVPPGRESHIWNLYEDLRMPLSGIIDIAKLALEGKLENAQEKVDGQNITFTVRDGVLRFFTKMSLVSDRDLNNASAKIQSGKGMDLSLISEKYGDKPGIVAAFSMGYEALEPVALQFQDSLFKNGDVVIVSGLITAVNPSTIIYDADTFRFIAPVSLTQEPVNEEAYGQFLQQARAATTEVFSMDSVPVAKLISDLETDDAEIETLVGDLESVVSDAGLSVGSATVGDYVAARVEKLLREKYSFIPEEMIADVTNRFMTGKGAVANRLKKLVSIEDYQRFRQLDGLKSEVVAEAIVPLEAVIQRLGVMIIDKLDLTLTASNQDDLRAFVRTARDAFSKGKILADEKTLERIRVALARLEENEELFTKATEGIVFTYNGNTYKLTGLFTPINRLRGFFDYDKKADIQDDKEETGDTLQEMIERAAERFLLEGGVAFKDSQGNVVTRQERIPRAEVEPIVSSFVKDILSPMGIEYVPVGTTSTNYPTAGDIDIGVAADDAKSLLAQLSENPDLQVEIPEAPGVSRLYRLPGGGGVAVLYKVPATGDLVQVDLMPTKGVSLDDFSWLLAGAPAGGVKGRYRNILLSLIANRLSKRESEETGETVKYTYARGLLKKVDNIPTGPRETDPDVFLPRLGITMPKEGITSFEGLVGAMRENPILSEILPEFKDYIDNRGHLQSNDPERRAEAEEAIRYIENLQENLLESLIRYHIGKILEEEVVLDAGGTKPIHDPKTKGSLAGAIEDRSERVSDALKSSNLPTEQEALEEIPKKINKPWLIKNGADSVLYDKSTNKFYDKAIPALLLAMEDSEASNEGEMFERGVIEYARVLEGSSEQVMKKVVKGKGKDIQFTNGTENNRIYESKKSKSNDLNLIFNATFPVGEENLYYLFVTKVPTRAKIKAKMDELRDKYPGAPWPRSEETGDLLLGGWFTWTEDEQNQMISLWSRSEKDVSEEVKDVKKKIEDLKSLIKSDSFPVSITVYEEDEEKEFESKEDLELEIARLEDLLNGLDNQEDNSGLQKELEGFGSSMEVYIVSSVLLRKTITTSAFPGSFEKNGDVDVEKLLGQIKDYLQDYPLAEKVTNMIAPEALTQFYDGKGLEKDTELGNMHVNMGLLNVRMRISIEPSGTDPKGKEHKE